MIFDQIVVVRCGELDHQKKLMNVDRMELNVVFYTNDNFIHIYICI